MIRDETPPSVFSAARNSEVIAWARQGSARERNNPRHNETASKDPTALGATAENCAREKRVYQKKLPREFHRPRSVPQDPKQPSRSWRDPARSIREKILCYGGRAPSAPGPRSMPQCRNTTAASESCRNNPKAAKQHSPFGPKQDHRQQGPRPGRRPSAGGRKRAQNTSYFLM